MCLKYWEFWILFFISLVLTIITGILLWVTATKDPATIPSRTFLMKAYERKTDRASEEQRNKYLDVVNGKLTKIKYCYTCDIYRPPRAIHCGLCHCCIERLDHHCPWLGTCIGKRNYKYFIVFVTLLAVLCVKVMIFSILHAADSEFSSEGSISVPQIISIVNAVFVFILGFFVFYLFSYHQYLICRNETTNENLKGSYTKLGNPFDKGCWDNISRLFRRDKRNWKPESEIQVLEKSMIKKPT